MKAKSTREMIDYPRTGGEKGLKQFLTLLSRSLTSLIGLLRFACCFMVSLEVAVLWGV